MAKKQSLKELKWQNAIFKAAQMTKNNLSRTSNEEKQSVRKLKWWETIFKAAEIKKSNFQTSSKDKKNL